MPSARILLVVLVQLGLAGSSQAGIFFNRQPKPATPQQAQELIAVLKRDPKESRRASAAEQLRHVDPRSYPEIVPALLDALRSDPEASVRAEAAQSLGKMGLLSAEVGRALDQAAQKDSSWRVRWHAKSAAQQYHKAGLLAGPPHAAGPIPTTSEPPLAEPPLAEPPADPAPPLLAPPRPLPGSRRPPAPAPTYAPAGRTPQPTLSPYGVRLVPAPEVAQPLPATPVSRPSSPLVPAEPPQLQTPPAPGLDDGPELNAPR